jgi:hypothetical protein
MERVKPFTERDVRCNKYTIINGKLVITYTKTLNDCMKEINEALYNYLTGGTECLKLNVRGKRLF